MADVTISDLNSGTPSNADVIPYSTGTATNKVSVSNLKTALSVPAAQVNSDWNATAGVAQILNKPSIGIGGIQIFTSTSTFTVPSGVTKLKITVMGGGGGGCASGNLCPPGCAGGSTFITGIDIVGGGGNGGTNPCFNPCSTGAGGVASGTLAMYTRNGTRSSSIGFAPLGLNTGLYGLGGTGASLGQGGGFAIGVATVTSGQVLTVNVGGGGSAGNSGGAGGAGVALIEW